MNVIKNIKEILKKQQGKSITELNRSFLLYFNQLNKFFIVKINDQIIKN